MPLTTYTQGEVLTAASLNANLSFAASSPAGGLTLITAETAFSGATVSVNNVFSATYTNYKIILKVTTSSDQVALRLRVAGVDSSTGYYGVNTYMYSSNSALIGSDVQQNATSLSVGNQSCFNNLDIFQPFVASQTFLYSNGVRYESTTPRAETTSQVNGRSLHSVATAYDGFTLLPITGSTLTGSYTIYGYAKA
jgi:hypothetical protein